MKRRSLKVLLAAVVVALTAAGGSADADPTSDRVCVYGGWAPILFVEHCVDVPGYPAAPAAPVPVVGQ
ncbi:MAG TPA: hypothetical protein VM840_07635 [Actinomycetota bacterium]|nr:hypothetical protein [Actinomycetota bacterium]